MSKHSPAKLSAESRQLLLKIARQGVKTAAAREALPNLEITDLPAELREEAACFVTLTKNGQLRGCTGTLVAERMLAQEVLRTAAQTATSDPRFPAVTAGEEPDLEIEISILTPPQKLDISSPDELPHLIRPGIDGVTLRKGFHRATFLPQVWEKIPDPVDFLDRLCLKMGLSRRAWLVPGMEVEIYQVEEFSDSELASH